ncbi:MAG: DUF4339 domain-containing protein [Gloeobacteraceae cyanobacterium ES-bin-144]|nr:DUF4339 domain-containing protein [Verrucomicrobiales bacterium]
MVWRQGMEQWKPAGEIDGLFERRVVTDPENGSVSSNESLGQTSPASDFGPLRSGEHFKDGELSLFSQGMTIITLPLAILIASVGWVLFWLLYDVLWSLLPVDEIRIPWVVLIFVFGGSGYIMGKPLGLWARKIGFIKRSRWSYIWLFLLTGVAALLGEMMYAGCLLMLADKPAGPSEIISFLVQPYLAGTFMDILSTAAQFLLRTLVALGAAVGARSVIFPEDLRAEHSASATS